MTLEEAGVRSKTATRNFIKRQLTWWRGQLPDWQ
jgi:tRNA A37 N6-isopentenylltransferase MiaA